MDDHDHDHEYYEGSGALKDSTEDVKYKEGYRAGYDRNRRDVMNILFYALLALVICGLAYWYMYQRRTVMMPGYGGLPTHSVISPHLSPLHSMHGSMVL